LQNSQVIKLIGPWRRVGSTGTLFERVAGELGLEGLAKLTIDDPVVLEAADLLGLSPG
jgi:hypothetical protein